MMVVSFTAINKNNGSVMGNFIVEDCADPVKIVKDEYDLSSLSKIEWRTKKLDYKAFFNNGNVVAIRKM